MSIRYQSFMNYLYDLLGKDEKSKLMKAIQQNKTIVVSGPQQSGKTTLVRLLQDRGNCNAVEDIDIYELKLSKPLGEKKYIIYTVILSNFAPTFAV